MSRTQEEEEEESNIKEDTIYEKARITMSCLIKNENA
jgi:hypothetical protein